MTLPAQFSGAVGYHDFVTENGGLTIPTDSNLLIKEVDDEVRLVGFENHWLQAICSKTNKTQPISNRKFEWMKDIVPTGEYTVGAGGLAENGADTTLPLNTTMGILPNSLLVNPRATVGGIVTGEVVMVTANSLITTDAAGDVTVRRDAPNGSATPALWSEGDTVFCIGTSYGDKATLPSSFTRTPSMDYNYAQRFLYTIEITEDMMKMKSHLKNPRAYWHKILMDVHLTNEERLAIFGQRNSAAVAANGSNTSDGGYHYLTGGCRQFISTNIIDLSNATLTESLFRGQFDQIFNYGSKIKTAFLSRAAAEHISNWKLTGLQRTDEGNKIGYKVAQYEGGSGVLNLCPTDILKNVTTGGFTGDEIIILDTEQVSRRVHTPTTLKLDAGNPESFLVIKDRYHGCYGWDWGVEATHAIIRNWKAA